MAKVKAKAASLPPLIMRRASEFKRDAKTCLKRGKDMDKLRAVVEILCSREALDSRHVDHPLTCGLKGWRDCHIEPDWLLIYKVTATELILGRTGTHADLF